MRIKFSVARHARKKKVLKRASGYYGDKSRRLRMATQQLDKSGVHAYVGRKDKKTTYRQLWITRINAAVREEGLSYSKFISGAAWPKPTSRLTARCCLKWLSKTRCPSRNWWTWSKPRKRFCFASKNPA